MREEHGRYIRKSNAENRKGTDRKSSDPECGGFRLGKDKGIFSE
jgi:hypothetical protein